MFILNYLFIGVCFSLFTDIVLYLWRDHPLVINGVKKWGYSERIICVLLWPITLIVFGLAFFKAFFK
tara:strand:+ start:229 stop:429 length:201 start_codon:yes stop_codon:yes gene_type:complete